MELYNPTFRAPDHVPHFLRRSPTPPHAYIEPLSPRKPQPIEPTYSYPPIRHEIDYFTRPERAPAATSRPCPHGAAGHGKKHYRMPSTIDTLAEAALVVSTSGQSYEQMALLRQDPTTHHHGQLQHHSSSSGEPPHKRARSGYLTSPHVGAFASRPATSYEHASAYESRVEEAALLLNFKTGTWPSNGTQGNGLPRSSRPHANSFPQDASRPRASEVGMQPTRLSPSEGLRRSYPSLPMWEETSEQHESGLLSVHVLTPDSMDVDIKLPAHASITRPRTLLQTETPPEDADSCAASTDIVSSEASEPPKARRGWPKGKRRNTGVRKSLADKVATKRAAARKKTTNVSTSMTMKPVPTRRKSLSDATASFESRHDLHVRFSSVPRDVAMIVREASLQKGSLRKPKVKADIVCAGCAQMRETSGVNSELDGWISCNGCQQWLHIDCAGFKKAHEVRDVDKYFCTACESKHGETTFVRKSSRAHVSVDYAELQKGVLKTSEESNEHHYIQPIKDGTFQFDPESFLRMPPEMLTKDMFEKSGVFTEPICIPAQWNPRPWLKQRNEEDVGTKQTVNEVDGDATTHLLLNDFEYDTVQDDGQDKLDMVMPENLTVRQVCNLVGPDTPLDVIDVKTQNSGSKWTLGRWADYYEEAGDNKAIRNVISLEVSHTKLGRLLRRPKVVRDIDLQDAVWPREELDKGRWPKVQFYCLMSVADSYTDFHIDFGGSSVYYHILKGKKTFFFIPPKAKHLKAYEEWNDSPQQNFTFLPSITKECYRVDLHAGDTMLIPSGWIHAVWTPETSLVVGGNFLTRMSFKNQFKVMDIEKANGTPVKFRYPFFQKIMWYTAIQYLKADPLPQAVSQLFHDGKRFERQIPVWQDFDGDVVENDARQGACNARYYSQAEIEGLPDLVNYIFRTVMIVKGHTEGVTQDQIKRVNASIPKGHGGPLELAKTFALWVAWKRGNEDPPAWAHPDAALPNNRDEGSSRKLSTRALRDMERKEAIAAWRVAPDRQSARFISKAPATADGASPSANSSPAPPRPSQQPLEAQLHQIHHGAPSNADAVAASQSFMTPVLPGHHLSSPKTSVLGPKRVACDQCRRRRIRCKHKDVVLTVTPSDPHGMADMSADATFRAQLAPELHDSIIVAPSQRLNSLGNGRQDDHHGARNGDAPQHLLNGHTPNPGTNAYVTANIPMTMNGVPIFGEVSRRGGRTKACYECRKSKRRCVHDDDGNVDPVKAAEPPVSRGSTTAKRVSLTDDGSPAQLLKKPKLGSPAAPTAPQMLPTTGILIPNKPFQSAYMPEGARPKSQRPPRASPRPRKPGEMVQVREEQPPIDPTLLSMYPEPEAQGPYASNSSYPYPTTEQHASFGYQSLEQIASQVLDMNGGAQHDEYAEPPAPHDHVHVYDAHATAPMTNGSVKPEESVDSAVSLPPADGIYQEGGTKPAGDANPEDTIFYHGLSPVQKFVEASRHANGEEHALQSTEPNQALSKSDVSTLPLYKPPAPLSLSPEATRRTLAADNAKRKRDSLSATPSAAKKAKVESPLQGEGKETEDERLARMLIQEDLGLRKRRT